MSTNSTPAVDSGRALDPLTGLANRIGVEQFLAEWMAATAM